MMEVQQQHSPVGVGPLDFSRRGVAEASAFRVVKPKQPASSLVHQQPLPPETNNNENLQENPQIPVDAEGKSERSDDVIVPFAYVDELSTTLARYHCSLIFDYLSSNIFHFHDYGINSFAINHVEIG